jgi:hypothetical protein
MLKLPGSRMGSSQGYAAIVMLLPALPDLETMMLAP